MCVDDELFDVLECLVVLSGSSRSGFVRGVLEGVLGGWGVGFGCLGVLEPSDVGGAGEVEVCDDVA